MKRYTSLFFALMLLTFAPEAFAADPKLQVEIDAKFGATAKLIGQSFKWCAINGKDSFRLIRPVGAGGVIASAPYGYGNASDIDAAAFLRAILVNKASIQCTNNPKLTDKGVQFTAITGATEIVIVAKDKLFSPDAISPKEYTLRFDPAFWGQAVLDELGELETTCAAERRKPDGSTEKNIGCTARAQGNFLKFDVAGEVRAGTITATFVSNKKRGTNKSTLIVPVDLCRFMAVGRLGVLTRGATRQRIAVAATEGQTACAAKPRALSHIDLNGTIRPLQPVDFDSQVGPGFELEVDGVPKDLGLGRKTFNVFGVDGSIGEVELDVVEEIKPGETLKVDYRLPMFEQLIAAPLGIRPPSNLRAYFERASGVSKDKIAVVNPMVEHPFIIANTADIAVPASLPAASTANWDRPFQSPPSGTDIDESWSPSYEIEMRSFWVIQNPQPAVVRISNHTQPAVLQGIKQAASWWALGDRPDQITFEVRRQSDRPVQVDLALIRVVKQTFVRYQENDACKTTPAECEYTELKADKTTYQTLLKTNLELATKARRESVPLPVRTFFDVHCRRSSENPSSKPSRTSKNSDIALNGQTIAIENEAVRAGQCELRLVPDEDLSDSEKNLKRFFPLFGPQTILVTVRREGVDEVRKVWPLRIDGGDYVNQSVVLPFATADNDAKGLYRVSAQVAATPNGDAIYREAKLEKALDEILLRDHSDLHFSANLRPRGPLGWTKAPIRTYITGSLSLTGLRFPAAANELRHSRQSANIQLMAPRTSVLFSLEPFCDDSGENPWPLDPAFQFGVSLTNLPDVSFAPTILTGAALTIPVIEGAPSQLGTKIALGFYWEHDPRFAGRYANHFITTLGLNIGSLLSGNTK